MTVTSIVTQGRAESSEYVETFGISYGSNGLDYAEYKESSGNTKVINNTQYCLLFSKNIKYF